MRIHCADKKIKDIVIAKMIKYDNVSNFPSILLDPECVRQHRAGEGGELTLHISQQVAISVDRGKGETVSS